MRAATHIVVVTAVALLAATPAFSQTGNSIPHLRPVHQGEVEELAATAAPALFRVRANVPVESGFFAPPVASDGIAVFLRIGDEPVLVTTYAYLATAESLEVWTGSVWATAEVTYGTPLFDLAALTIDDELLPEAPLELAAAWPTGVSVYVPLGTHGGTDEPEAVVGALSRDLPQALSYFVRAHVWQRNGYPILGADGEVLALTARFSPDGVGVLAIPFEEIAAWWSQRDALDPENPFHWEPEVRVETVQPRVNEDAFEIRTRLFEEE